MKHFRTHIRLLLTFLVVLTGSVLAWSFDRKAPELSCAPEMRQAVQLAGEWFRLIGDLKKERGISSDAASRVPNAFMIGDEWSDITTTLGSQQAKEISSNPDFAALVLRWLSEDGIKKGDKVGLILSGSFPSLAISTLAALQTMEADVVMFSSVGASTYGANQPDLTWLDMENQLRQAGDLRFSSAVVSAGANGDNGSGINDEGLKIIEDAAARNGVSLYHPQNIEEAILYKTKLLQEENISLLINIGGNMASMGACTHSLSIPNGFHRTCNTCSDSTRGILMRMNETGVPFIHLLDIKDLAIQYGIDPEPGTGYAVSTRLYTRADKNRLLPSLILGVCLLPLFFISRKNLPKSEKL